MNGFYAPLYKPFNIKTGFVIQGRNHCHCYSTAASLFKAFGLTQEDDRHLYVEGVLRKEREEGFITDRGNFVDRKVAAQLAFEAGQIDEPQKKLYSEDIFRRSDHKKE